MSFKPSQDQFLGIIRHALTLAGALLIVSFPNAEGFINEIGGSAAILVGLVWSAVDKWSTGNKQDIVEGLFRHAVGVGVVILTFLGSDTGLSVLDKVLTYGVMLIPILFSLFDKKKRTSKT